MAEESRSSSPANNLKLSTCSFATLSLSQGAQCKPRRNRALFSAASGGHAGVVGLLLQDARVDPAAELSAAFRTAAVRGCSKVLGLLLADGRSHPGEREDEALRSACEHGHELAVELLLSSPRVDPAAANNGAIIAAARHGHARIVSSLLVHPFVEPSAQHNAALRMAAQYGHAAVLDVLLADPRVDPLEDGCVALEAATEAEKPEAVQCLLRDPRVNAAADAISVERAFLMAIRAAYMPLVKQLHTDRRCGRSVDVHAALCAAADTKNASEEAIAVLEMLLADARGGGSASTRIAKAVAAAANAGNAVLVEKLMQDPRFEHFLSGAEVHTAAREEKYEVLRALTRNIRLSPTASDGCAVLVAADAGDVSFLRSLLTAPKLDPSNYGAHALWRAAELGHVDIVRLLLADKRLRLRDYWDDSGDDDDDEPEPTVPPWALHTSYTAYAQQAVTAAARSGRIEILGALLSDSRLQSVSSLRDALIASARAGQLEAMEFVLSKFRIETTPAKQGVLQLGLAAAVAGDQPHIVERLLRDGSVRPDATSAVEAAKLAGDGILQQLLACPVIDPQVAAQGRLVRAAGQGDLRCVESLLSAHPALDLSFRNCAAVRAAASAGHYSVVERLLTDDRMTEDLWPGQLLSDSVQKKQTALISCLLGSRCPAPALALGWYEAVDAGATDAARLFLADSRLDIVARLAALNNTEATRCWDAVDLLMHDDTVLDALDDPAVLEETVAQLRSAVSEDRRTPPRDAPHFGERLIRLVLLAVQPEALTPGFAAALRRGTDLVALGAALWRRRRAAVLAWADAH